LSGTSNALAKGLFRESEEVIGSWPCSNSQDGEGITNYRRVFRTSNVRGPLRVTLMDS